jgi:AcrR family transcriptional regulator
MVDHSPTKRSYLEPGREAAAAETRRRLLEAAKDQFENHGWAGTRLSSVADSAGVSLKTLEAIFGTKAALLRDVVNFAIRGDAGDMPLARSDLFCHMEQTPSATKMLDLHARTVTRVSERSASLAWTVEHAAAASPPVSELWQRMTRNRRDGVRWAARTLLDKPDARTDLKRRFVEETFWIALDWNTYRALVNGYGGTPRTFERWLRTYYKRTLGS